MKSIKKSDAKDLICPFMTNLDGSYKNIKCITDKCMAWKPDEIGVGEPDRLGRFQLLPFQKNMGDV